MFHARRGLRVGLALFTLALSLGSARAETVHCTPIESVPTIIGEAGIYCLTSSLTTDITSGAAIRIAAHNVTIDLNGHNLDGFASPATEAIGIHAREVNNVTVRNGRIRGFRIGVWLEGAPGTGGHLVENLRVDRCRRVAISLEARNSVVRGNLVSDVGEAEDLFAYGITMRGPGNRLIDNDVVGTWGQIGVVFNGEGGVIENNRVAETGLRDPHALALGISITRGHGGMVSGNRVVNTTINPGSSTGIHLTETQRSIVRDNDVSGMREGIVFWKSTGTYGGNIVQGAVTPYSGGSPAGSTNY